MKRVRQTGPNDCFSAAVASLLGLPRNKVPTFAAGPSQIDEAQRWLERKHNLTLATILIPHDRKLTDLLPECDRPWRFIAVVPVQGGKWWHAVVAEARGETARVIHDPGGWKRIRLSLANEIRLILPLFKKGFPWRPSQPQKNA